MFPAAMINTSKHGIYKEQCRACEQTRFADVEILTNFVVYTYQSSWLQCLKHQGRSHCDPKLSWNKERNHIVKVKHKQECIPVGCVPSAAVAVCWGRGVSARRGMCVCPPPVNRIADTCENIALPQLRCGR